MTEEDAEKADADRKRKAEETVAPVVDFGKKKKLLDNKKHLLGGFGGLKVKGKSLKVSKGNSISKICTHFLLEPEKVTEKPKEEKTEEPANNALGLLCAYSDSDSD